MALKNMKRAVDWLCGVRTMAPALHRPGRRLPRLSPRTAEVAAATTAVVSEHAGQSGCGDVARYPTRSIAAGPKSMRTSGGRSGAARRPPTLHQSQM